MVRETRHLWVGNLPDDIREEKLVEHFARYGRVESAKLTGKRDADGSQSAFVDFVDINSATKAHDASVITIGERDLQIEYNNPDSPTEIHPGDSSREYELPGRIPRYENRRGGTVEDRYDPAGSTYEFDRSYGQHYGRENSQYRDESSSSPAYRERQRERTRANFYSHSRSSDQYENDPDYLKDSYGENFGDASLRKSRLKPFKTLPGQSKSPSARSGSGSGRKSKSNSRSRSRSRSKSTDSHSSDTGSEGWSRSRSRDRESDRESRNTETTQSSLGGSSKFSGLCVRNLPARSSDSSIKDGLFHEFKKYGQVTAVTVQGVGEDRKGIVFFKRAEDMEKAMEASRGNSFFGCEMALSVWDGADLGVDDSEVKYFEKELDEFHPRATRTLFVGNLDRSVTREDLNEAFHKFGEIVHIEIKKPAGAQPFAFLQFSDIDSVVRARKKLDGEYVGKNKVKLGFGKSMATNCVWLDNLSQKVTEKYLMQFCGLRFGEVTRVVHDRRTNMALVFFINIDDSQKAVQDLKIGSIMGRRPKVDFASRECQNHFYDRMEQTGQAAYYNHSGETSPSCPTYPERNFKKSSGEYRSNYNSSTPFEPRRAPRAQSSGGGFTKYSSGSYEDRYPYPTREEGYHDRPYSKEYSSIRSSSYDGDDYQQELLEYGYHQKERTKEQYRERSRSSSPSCRDRSADGRQKSLSVEPADDAVSPVGSVDEGPVSRSPSPKRKWKGNSLMVQNSKEGSSTPMPRSPLSEEGLPEEPLWKNRNGNTGSERGSSLDQTDLLRKTKSKLSLDIPREEDLIERKKKVPPKLPVDKSSSPYLERPKGDPSLHGDSHLDRTRDSLEGDKDSWVDKFKDKKSPRSDFVIDKPALKGLDVETVSSLPHDLDSGKRWKDEESNADSMNDASSVGDHQKKLEARKQRFSDNSPVDIQKIRKERYFPPSSSKVPKLGKGNIRDSEYIPKGGSFLGDSRTVEDSHMSHKEGLPPDPSDSSNGGPPCKHNDRIDSFWWMPGQKLYSDDEKGEKSSEAAADGSLQPQQPCSSETAVDGGTTQAALNKPKKSIPDNSNLSQDRTRKRHKGRIPHISNDMDEGIASSSDQETPGSEEELGLKPLNSHSAHSNALQVSQGSDSLHASVKSTAVDTFEKPPQLDSKLTYRKQVEIPRNKSFDVKQQARQRHPSAGDGQQVLEGKTKVMDEKGRSHNSKRKEPLGTVIQEMEWKMIPLDPITFPPSGRKEQIDAIFFGSGSDVNHPAEGGVDLKTDSKAAGSLLSDLNNIVSDQYCNPLSLNTVENENTRIDSDQLPLLSPKPGVTKVGNTASPPTSAPPHLSPAVTPLKTKDDIQADLTKANVNKLIGESLHPKPNSVILDNRNCQKTPFPDRDVNEKSSYLRPGEEKVNSWLRQIPSPTLPVPIDSTGESREQRTFLLIGSNNGSPSLSVTPSTPSTPSTPNDGRIGEVLSTKTRVERLSMCRIVKKNRNSVDVDSRNDKKAANDELIKYFQDRMQQNSIFSLDEARLNPDQSKLRLGVTPSISASGSLLAKSKSEDVGPAESMKLNRSNSDPRMAAGSKLLSLPKSIDSTAAGMQQVSTLTSASLSSTLDKDQDAVTNETSSAKPDVGKEDSDIGRSAVDHALKRPTPTEVTKDSLISPSLPITKEIPKLKSILKKRTDSVDDVEDMDDVCSKDIEQGIKRKRSPSPVSGEAKKMHIASVDTSERKTEDSTLPSAPKFQHPTNMLLLTPNERTKKFVVKPRSKPKMDKNAVLPVGTKKPVEKAPVVKKEVSTVKKEVSKGIGEMVKSKSVMREKGNLKSSGKKVEKKEERKISAEKKTDDKKGGEKKVEEKKHVEKKNVVDRKEEKKSSEKQEARKGEEKVSERKVEDVKEWKKEEKKVEKKDEKKDEKKTVMERKVERRSDDKKQSEKKTEEKKSVKKSDEKKVVKDGKADDKRGSERKVLEKKSSEKKGEEKRGGEKKVEEKKTEKRGDEKKAIERKGDEKKVTEKKLEEKKVEKKEDRKVEERKVSETQKKTSEKKVEKKVEEKRQEKKMEEKKPLEKKGDKKGAVSVVAEKRKPEKVIEKSKDTKSSEKSLLKKSEEKISETRPVEKEKSDKSKSKSSKKLQKADSADSKMKKPAVKETLKVRSKSEDKPKGKSPQVSPEKSSTSTKKVSKKLSGSSSTPVVSDGTGFGPGGFGGGVRALMDSYAESDSSESEDDEFEIFHQAASSGLSKTQKTPALKKNVIFSSSDESDSEETTERRNPNPVLQKLFDRESLSDSDFDEKPSSSLVMSSEAEESPSRKQSPVKGKGKQIPEKSGRDKIEKEKSVETKKSKVEKEPKEVEKPVKRNEAIETAEVKKGQDTKKSSPSKKTEVKAESRTKDKSGRSRSKKEGKESKASKVEETEEMVEVPVSKSKAKKRETEMEKMHSRGKKMEVFDDSLSETFDEPIREPEEEVKTNVTVEPEVKVPKGKQSKKSGKSRDKTKKGKNKSRHDFVEKQVVSADEPVLDSWKDNVKEEVESKAEIEASVPVLEEEIKEPDPEPELEPLPEIKPDDDGRDNDVDNSLENPPVQEYETEVVVEKATKEEEPPIVPVSKVTKGKQKRKKGKHRQTKKGKKAPHPPPSEEPAPVIPEITVSSESVEPVKQDEDRITAKEPEIPERQDDEVVLKSEPPPVNELPEGDETSEMIDECTDAEKAAAMFEETAEATAALELVEIDEQQRQRELAEEIFGEATPTAPSPSAPPTPSPTLPSPRPASPRPSTPEIPETAHADEVTSTSEVKIPEVVVSSIKEEVEEDAESAKVEKPSPSVHIEEMEQEQVKTEKEETEIDLKDKICDEVKTEMELPKFESISADNVTAPEPAVKVEDEVRVKTEAPQVKSEEILNEMKETSQPEEAGSISFEAATVEIPLQCSSHGNEPKSSVPEGSGVSEVKVNSGLPEVNVSENSEVKLEDVPAPLKLGDSSQELKAEDLEGAEETASVEVTTETASEANDSLVIAPEALDMPAPFELPEKLPTTPTHKGKKKKKRKHRDKKNSKREGRKVDKEKKKKRKKSKSREGKRKRQKTSHKSGRHRSASSSSYHGDLSMDSHKNMERITEQATSASMEPVVNPSGLPIHKIENQQVFFSPDQHWHPGMDGMGNNFYRIPASMPGFPPGMPPMFNQSTAPIDNRFMKPPLVNSNLCPNDGNTSPLQTINADDMSLKIVGVNDNIKLINFRGMKVDTPGQVQVAGMLSPSSSEDKTKKRHPSGKAGIVEASSLPHSGGSNKVDGQTLDQMQHMVSSGQAVMVKEEVEERGGAGMQNKSQQMTDSTMQGNIVGKDATQEGYFEGASESENAKVNTKDFPQKGGDGATEERSQEGDVYDFNEEEPSVAGRADQTRLGQSRKNASVDVYEFQESPGPSSTKASPSKMASVHRGKQKSRTRGGGRTRSNSRGSAKDLKVKEEGPESGGVEETKKVESQVFPQKIEGEAETLHKGAVAELVPSSDSKVVAKSEDPGSIHHPMPLSLPNSGGVLAGLLPIVAISQAEKQMMYAADPHVRMMANVSAAQTTMATALQNKQGNGRMMPCHNSALTPSVSMPAVVAALNNNPANAKQHPHMDIRNTISQAPVTTTGSRKPSSRKRTDKKMAAQYQPQYTQQQHPQQIRNIPSTQSQVEAVELHFKESLMRNQRQNMVHKPASSLSTVQLPPGQPVAVITSQAGISPAMITPTGTSSASASREAPAITSQLIGVGTHSYGNRSPAMAEGMKSGPHTVASVPESQTSPDTSVPGVTRSGMHPNLPSTLVSVPTPTPSKRQQGMINSKYECRVPTSVAATSYPDASVLRARLTQIEPKHRGNEEGKLLTAEGQVPGAFLHPSGFVEKPSGHGDEKVDPIKPGDRNVPTEQRLPAAYHPDGHMVYFNPRPDGHPVIRGPGPVMPGMFPDPTAAGLQGLPIPGLVHPGMDIPKGLPHHGNFGIAFGGPFPPRMFHPSLVHGDQNQPLASPRALASPRMVVPNTSSPRLSPKIKSPGLGHGDRTAQTPDKQAEHHNVVLRHAQAPGITTGIPPPGPEHPEVHNIPHRGLPHMMAQQPQLSKTERDIDKAPEDRRHHQGPPGQHGIPPHIQQLPAQNIPEHTRTTPGPHPERGSPGSHTPGARTPGPDGRPQQVILPNSSTMKQWPAPGISPHTPMAVRGSHPASPIPSMGGEASVMLYVRYPVMWQGMLALKQEIATIQLHYICGNKVVATDALKMAYPPLRIAQRMRLEDSQLDGVARRMQVSEESVVLLALPCGSDQDEILNQTSAMRAGLISYLKEKQAAGIINVGPPGCTDPSYVIHIFPPCEFTERSLSHKAPDLLESVMNVAYMMFVIATC